MTVAVLALQGAFAEHEKVLKRLGVNCIELRQAKDLETSYDGIILPGGESTVQGKLLKELGMFDTIKEQIENGMPVLATCAGLILLASEVEGQEGCHFGTIPMCVRRNAYGRQLGSFRTVAELKGVGSPDDLHPCTICRRDRRWRGSPCHGRWENCRCAV